jgi:hypothetical protein
MVGASFNDIWNGVSNLFKKRDVHVIDTFGVAEKEDSSKDFKIPYIQMKT